MSTGGYLTLGQAGQYCGGRSVRWARRKLVPNIPYFQPPGSGILFKKSDIDTFLETHRKEPVDLDRIVRDVLGKRQKKRRSA